MRTTSTTSTDPSSGGLPDAYDVVRAWGLLRPERVTPAGIVPLKVQEEKSAVYRLEGVGRAGSAVVAKRCRRSDAAVERTVYETILPKLRLPHLHYYGSVADADEAFAWLFVEDAGEDAIARSDHDEQCLAARWLALLHMAARSLAGTVELPDHTPRFYRDQARAVRQAIHDARGNPNLQREHWTVLETIDEQMGLLDAHWSEIEAVCDGFPVTLVHGDFVRKNVRLRQRSHGTELIALDWETAGWGIPAIDLCRFVGAPVKPDLSTYHAALRDNGQAITLEQVEELAHVGSIFRLVSAIRWASLRLHQEWVGKCMVWMECYRTYMVMALHATRWGKGLPAGELESNIT